VYLTVLADLKYISSLHITHFFHLLYPSCIPCHHLSVVYSATLWVP